MVWRGFILAGSLALAACASAPAAAPPVEAPACSISANDQAWVNRALGAWRYAARDIAGIRNLGAFDAVFFDDHCVLKSTNALTRASTAGVTWTYVRHTGAIALPDGGSVPAGVTSFAHPYAGGAYFVMSTPSVWRAAGVDNAGIGLEPMMVAVLLHESSHVAQIGTYGTRVDALVARNHLGDDFDDDSLQRRFGDDASFAASISRETDLFFQAAAATDLATARRLAAEARAMMKARASRFYVGGDAYWGEAENLWLTFEGAGQWVGYTWLIDPHGANVSVDIAMPSFGRRTRWWSQNEGLAVFLALDRIAGHGWRAHAFGDGAQTVLQMLDAALAAPSR